MYAGSALGFFTYFLIKRLASAAIGLFLRSSAGFSSASFSRPSLFFLIISARPESILSFFMILLFGCCGFKILVTGGIRVSYIF